MGSWRKVCRCKKCGVIFPNGVKEICEKCGEHIADRNELAKLFGIDRSMILTENCEMVIAKKRFGKWILKESE